MNDIEKEIEININRNEKFIAEFDKWLMDKKLTDKTIIKHISNMDLFLNKYLNYYEIKGMEEGIYEVDMFLGDWFIRKCMWASKHSIRETASSIKKFYECMSENNYVTVESYKMLCVVIKENMPNFFASLEEYDNGTSGYFQFL